MNGILDYSVLMYNILLFIQSTNKKSTSNITIVFNHHCTGTCYQQVEENVITPDKSQCQCVMLEKRRADSSWAVCCLQLPSPLDSLPPILTEAVETNPQARAVMPVTVWINTRAVILYSLVDTGWMFWLSGQIIVVTEQYLLLSFIRFTNVMRVM